MASQFFWSQIMLIRKGPEMLDWHIGCPNPGYYKDIKVTFDRLFHYPLPRAAERQTDHFLTFFTTSTHASGFKKTCVPEFTASMSIQLLKIWGT